MRRASIFSAAALLWCISAPRCAAQQGTTNPNGARVASPSTIRDLTRLQAELDKALSSSNLDTIYSVAQAIFEIARDARDSRIPILVQSLDSDESRAAVSPIFRARHLGGMAHRAYLLGDRDKARAFATEALAIAKSNPASEALNIYWAHHVLGLVAADENDLGLAEEHLAASIATVGFPSLASRGPNFRLVQKLIEGGRKQAALDFFAKAKALWPEGRQRIDEWEELIRVGSAPIFGSADVLKQF